MGISSSAVFRRVLGGACGAAALIILLPAGLPRGAVPPGKEAALPGADALWTEVEDGLRYGEFPTMIRYPEGGTAITAARIDPRRFAFRLLSASETGGVPRTVGDWARRHGLVAAINAGMFLTDGITNAGYMRNFTHVNSRRWASYKAVLAFNRRDPSVPEIRIIDRECEEEEGIFPKYDTLIQGIRMVSCERKNVWGEKEDRWSIAAAAITGGGEVLFLFARTPMRVHDFIDAILALPLDVAGAIYVEGGAEASFYLSAGGITVQKGGMIPGVLSGDATGVPWPIPNVIGAVRK